MTGAGASPGAVSGADAPLGRHTRSDFRRKNTGYSDPRWARARALAVDDRVRACSSVALPSGVTLGDRSGRTSGIVRCGNVHACPRCRRVILAEKRTAVSSLVTWALAQGLYVYHVTYTQRHYRGERPRELMTADADAYWVGFERWKAWDLARELRRFKDAWRAMFKSKKWLETAHALGWAATRTIEVTHGRHGWHVHAHSIVVTSTPLDDQAWRVLGVLWSERTDASWEIAVKGRRILPDEADDIAAYVTKADEGLKRDKAAEDAAQEVTDATGKLGRAGQTPWQMLDASDEASARLWRAYAMAIKGTRLVTFPRQMMRAAAIHELADEVALHRADEIKDEPHERTYVTREAWRWFATSRDGWRQLDALRSALKRGADPAQWAREHLPAHIAPGVHRSDPAARAIPRELPDVFAYLLRHSPIATV